MRSLRSVVRCLSLSRKTRERVYGCWPNMVGKVTVWPSALEVIKFWRWSRAGCHCIYDHFSTSINVTQIGLCTTYCHSTGGATALLSDYAATLSETMQQPWESSAPLKLRPYGAIHIRLLLLLLLLLLLVWAVWADNVCFCASEIARKWSQLLILLLFGPPWLQLASWNFQNRSQHISGWSAWANV